MVSSQQNRGETEKVEDHQDEMDRYQKGDSSRRDIRSRIVAKHFNNSEESGLLAETPPAEALRMLVSGAATVGNEEKGTIINDVA